MPTTLAEKGPSRLIRVTGLLGGRFCRGWLVDQANASTDHDVGRLPSIDDQNGFGEACRGRSEQLAVVPFSHGDA